MKRDLKSLKIFQLLQAYYKERNLMDEIYIFVIQFNTFQQFLLDLFVKSFII